MQGSPSLNQEGVLEEFAWVTNGRFDLVLLLVLALHLVHLLGVFIVAFDVEVVNLSWLL